MRLIKEALAVRPTADVPRDTLAKDPEQSVTVVYTDLAGPIWGPLRVEVLGYPDIAERWCQLRR
ncbi:MAG: hypothetical protein ACRDZX_04635 [Acidimicrobiales bacterium]